MGYRIGVVVQDLYGAALSEIGGTTRVLARATTRLELALLRRVQGVAVIHDVFRRRLIAGGVPERQIHDIPNWAHVTMPKYHDRAAVRQRLGWADDEFIALHAGNMGAKQGLEGLIDLAQLAAETSSPTRVVLLGDGSRRAALTEYGRGIGRLTILDPLAPGRFESALLAADCLLLHEKPGVVEMSVPSKLTTYFAAGRPVVAATDARSGAASLMSAAKAGLVVPAGDARALLAAIDQLAQDPETSRALGEHGRQFAAEHLSSDASLRRTTEWLEGMHSAE
jgi:glycosyltransferase involved in cell wall biosynthesis